MRIAGVQMDIELANVRANLKRMTARLREATSHGAKLVVFPECAATGYCFETPDEAASWPNRCPGPITEQMTQACAVARVSHGVRHDRGRRAGRLFNVAVLVGPSGLGGGCIEKSICRIWGSIGSRHPAIGRLRCMRSTACGWGC